MLHAYRALQQHLASNIVWSLQLLDDEGGVVPIPPSALGTLKLVSDPAQAWVPGPTKLSSDKLGFVGKLKERTGTVVVRLMDSARTPLLDSPASGSLHAIGAKEAFAEVARPLLPPILTPDC